MNEIKNRKVVASFITKNHRNFTSICDQKSLEFTYDEIIVILRNKIVNGNFNSSLVRAIFSCLGKILFTKIVDNWKMANDKKEYVVPINQK